MKAKMPPPEKPKMDINHQSPQKTNSPLRLSKPNSQRTIEEMRAHIAKLKGELETEKTKNKQLHRDKITEIKQLKETLEKEKEHSVELAQSKLEHQKELELQKLKETLHKEKDVEIRQLIRYKEDELKQLKATFLEEKEDAVKVALELQKKSIAEQLPLSNRPGSGGNTALVVKLQREIKSLKDSKKELEELLRIKTKSDLEKAAEIRRLQTEHEAELNRLIKESKVEAARDLHQLKKAEEALQVKDQQITEQEILVGQLVFEREVLEEQVKGESGTSSSGEGQGTEGKTLSDSRRSSSNSSLDLASSEAYELQRKLHEERDREKERQLTRKVNDLNSQVTKLEKRVTLLKTENETLKKKTDQIKPSEEKIKKLKKRNAELAAIARRLEEKAKQLTADNAKRKVEPATESTGGDQLKKAFAKQRAKDLAEHAQKVMAKERELEVARARCHDLHQQILRSASAAHIENSHVYEEKEELEKIIKLEAKERLRLEKQIAEKEVVPSVAEAELARVKVLEETSAALQEDVTRLTAATVHTEKLEIELAQTKIECETLNSEINKVKEKCAQLEQELQDTVEKNTELSVHNSDLERRVHTLQQVNEECENLKHQLALAEDEKQQAKTEVAFLQGKVNSLEQQIEVLREAAGEHAALRRQHDDLVSQLTHKEQTLSSLAQAQAADSAAHEAALTGLQTKLWALEARYEAQAVDHDALTAQITALRKESEKAKERPPVAEMEIQTDENDLPVLLMKPSPRMDFSSLHPQQPPHGASSTMPKFQQPESNRRKGVETMSAAATASPEDDFHRKTPFQVFMAKYSYDPEQFSPNENPDAELVLNAGDYIFVYGDMDEDGFYEGELMDGRRGLVPSNFIEKVPDEELEEFHNTLGLHAHDDGAGGSSDICAGNLDFNSSDESEKLADIQEAVVSHCGDEIDNEENSTNSNIQISPVERIQISPVEQPKHTDVPFPRQLQVDRELSESLLVSWLPSPNAHPQASYHVYADGVFSTSVKATERLKALIEGVRPATQIHRVCVRTVTNRGQSKDAQCTLCVGPDVDYGPTELSVSHVTATTAVVSWLPSNSNYEHVVAVNKHTTKVAPPGVYRFIISGLAPGQEHEVCVSAQPPGSTTSGTTALVSFHSLPQPGTTADTGLRPAAPLDVQAEAGPRRATLLITWLPVTITAAGCVTGYTLYTGSGAKIKELHNPTGDHMLIEAKDLSHLPAPPQTLTLRTQAHGGLESHDSQPHVTIDPELMQEITTASMKLQNGGGKFIDQRQLSLDLTLGVSPTEGEAPPGGFRGGAEETLATQDSSSADVVKELEELADDSELSDIPEVDEELDDLTRSPHGTAAGAKTHVPRSPRQMPTPPSNVQVTHASPKSSPKFVAARTVDTVATTPASVGFRPIQQDGAPGGPGHSPSQHQQLPHIEITKDAVMDINENSKMGNQNTCNVNEPNNNQTLNTKKADSAFEHRGGPGPVARDRPRSKGHDSKDQQYEAKKRDYFECHRYDDEESTYSSYSALEDNNALTSKKIRDDIPDSDLIDYEDDGGDSLAESVPELEYDENKIRIFIALFDYDPITMSPNPDAIEEELPFKEGQLIKIFGDKDPDGFFLGESNGQRGFVPCNMVSEVQVDDPEIAAQLLKESNRATSSRSSRGPSRGDDLSHTSLNNGRTHSANLTGSRASSELCFSPGSDGPQRRMVALYDYDPQELSPNVDAEVELSFRTGDIIMIYGSMDEDGFFYGELRGQRGLVPSNFLQDAPLTAGADPYHLRESPNAHLTRQMLHNGGSGRGSSAMSTSPVPAGGYMGGAAEYSPGTGADRPHRHDSAASPARSTPGTPRSRNGGHPGAPPPPRAVEQQGSPHSARGASPHSNSGHQHRRHSASSIGGSVSEGGTPPTDSEHHQVRKDRHKAGQSRH